MKIEICQEFNKTYFEEYFGEWLNARTKYRKYQRIGGIASLASAGVFYFFDGFIFYFFLLLIYGLIMIFDFYFSKYKWMRDRLNNRMLNKEVKLIFDEDGIQTESPFSKSNSTWGVFIEAIDTDKGILLIPGNGVSMYLYKSVFEKKNDIEWIANRINAG